MANPGMPTPDPNPGGITPGEMPPIGPDDVPPPIPEDPDDEPGIGDPPGPGSEPDHLPGGPSYPGVRR